MARKQRWKEHFEEILNRPIPDDPVTHVEIDPIINEISNDSTIKYILILRNIIEQVVKWQATLYITFVDFKKAFDSMHRESLWKIMESYGIPRKIIHMVQMLYEDSKYAVLDEGKESECIKVKTGVKQGNVMSGFIFLMVVDWMMRNTKTEHKTGMKWNFTSKPGLIRWPYVASNQDILTKTKLKTIGTEVKIRRWKWVGHILRMDKNSRCETALTWTHEGRRKVGRPKTTWRSTVENERRILGWNSWNEPRRVAADRASWRRCTSA